jgi:hypothetical protein
LQNALLPDATDEVVEVFTGDSLEEAMAYAVATLGPDLTVRRARKVRKGVQGLRGKETYEVAAVPAPRVSGDVVGAAFETLLHEAEALEEHPEAAPHPTPRVRRTVRPPVAAPPPPALTAEPVVPAPTSPAPVTAAAPPAPIATPATEAAPAPPPAPAVAPVAEPVAVAAPAAVPAPEPAPRRAVTRPARPAPAPEHVRGWSRAALAALGLPERVLAALPAKDPRDDVAWLGALAKALGTALPAPASADFSHPVVVDGYGVPGVLGLLEAGAKGIAPGTITDHGRTAPATPLELALVIRAALVG